jgi:hypothetical protein
MFAVLVISVLLPAARGEGLDDFESLQSWSAHPADGVEMKLHQDAGRSGRAMRIDFAFRGAGYAIARRTLPMTLPENFEFSFWMRAEAPVNNFEFKLVDPSGENVWWLNRLNFRYPREWTQIRIKRRHLSFAWGPSPRPSPERIGSLEIVVTAGTGGSGSVWIDDLAYRELPPGEPPPVDAALTNWRGTERVELDLGGEREFGGLIIDWDRSEFPPDYDIELHVGTEWVRAYSVRGGNGGRDWIALPDASADRIRLSFAGSARINSLRVQPLAFAENRNAFFSSVARDLPPGSFPKYFSGKQSYWTVVGEPFEVREALINEEGMIEVDQSSFSIEPFVYDGTKLITWRDVTTEHRLDEGSLPIPTVTWSGADLRLETTAFTAPQMLYIRYRLRSAVARRVTLYAAIRPYQVNPPWQFLNVPGGASEIRRIRYDGERIFVDDQLILPRRRPDAFGATTFDGGEINEWLRSGTLPPTQNADDTFAAGSAALVFRLTLRPNANEDVVLAVPFGPAIAPADPARVLVAARDRWRGLIHRTEVVLPASAAAIERSFASNLAYILINADGAGIQPGSRSYTRSWIRDGSLTSAVLLRLGHADAVRRFIEWYAPYQFPNGKVPCCVDRRGADPVPENDSHGQLIYLIAEYYRFTRDRQFAEKMWPYVAKTVEYIDSLRQQRMTEQYRGGPFYGLVPESISHEGYSAKPMHSYWDDLFTLKGLKDAAWLAQELGRDAAPIAAMRDSMRKSLVDSYRLAMAQHKIDYLPGSVELGDFDATSVTVALNPAGEQDALDRGALERTFDRYLREFRARRQSTENYGYTPYEWRTVGTFIRLGRREDAHELVEFFMNDRRPPGWNHWGEVVFRDRDTPKFIGDMPHTWVGSDFMRSILDMLAYERDDGTIVVGAGVPPTWAQQGVRVRRLQTWWGSLDVTITATAIELGGTARPPGGFIVHTAKGEVRVEKLPARLPANG